MLEYATVAHDVRALEFVQRAYEHTWTYGIPRMGWINCYPAATNLCEGCALGDLVGIGIRLSDTGIGDYWDAVDGVVRNQLVEQQLIRADFLKRAAEAGSERTPDQRSIHPHQELQENVVERSLGIYGGTATPTAVPNVWSMTCCTGNGTQGLYYAWEGIVREDGETAHVNLLLNRAARLVDVESYLPYSGKVVIRNKKARRIAVRIPHWVKRPQLGADVSGARRPLVWVGNCVVFDGLEPGDALTLGFPVEETTASYTVNARTSAEQTYTCAFRGSTLVGISPRDAAPTSYPLYLRDHLRSSAAPTKTVERFVADRTVIRW
jgi:hypothetical protein